MLGAILGAILGGGLVAVAAALGAVFLYGAGAWVVHLFRTPPVLQLDAEAATRNAEADRDAALAARDEARKGEPIQPVTVTMLDPVRQGYGFLFRLCVHNDGDRKATYYGEVTEIAGELPGPEAPWKIAWRGSGERCEIPPDSEQFIDVASADIIDATRASAEAIERWRPHFRVRVAVGGRDFEEHPAMLAGIDSVADLNTGGITLKIRIWHDESHALVAEPAVRFFYEEDGAALMPRMGDI